VTIAALIAAAGKSSRMGTPKALLPLENTTFVEHIATCLLGAGIARILVSLPECKTQAQLIQSQLLNLPVQFIRNRYTRRELLGSAQSALADTDADFSALMIIPVDMPFVSTPLISRFVEAHQASGIFCATHDGQPGHPVMFTHHFFSEIMGLDTRDSLRTIMIKHPSRIVPIETDDPRLLLNINTREDYERFVNPSAKNFEAAAIDAPGVKFL
jgi:molybdenum cofactor cytidylyltransferase